MTPYPRWNLGPAWTTAASGKPYEREKAALKLTFFRPINDMGKIRPRNKFSKRSKRAGRLKFKLFNNSPVGDTPVLARAMRSIFGVVLPCACAILVSACVSSSPNIGFSEEEADTSHQASVISGFMDADTGEAALDEDGNAMRTAVPLKAQRGATPPDTTTVNAMLEVAALDPATVDTSNQDTPEKNVGTDQTEVTLKPVATDAILVEAAPTAQAEAQLATETEATPEETVAAPKKSFLQRLFADRPKSAATNRTGSNVARTERRERGQRGERARSGIVLAAARVQTPKVLSSQSTTTTSLANTGGEIIALPGVKSNAKLFGINTSETEEADGNLEVATLGSFTRISPKGLRLQHEKVDVGCLKPEILRIIKTVEQRYGKKPIITSGYRSPKRNRRAGGARNSSHIYCKAVDLQVEGISKWDLAKYLRTLPGRGGVGTYCRTRSVHVDTGSKRDWHHPCRRSSVKKVKT